jgi:hypothetical protein
MNTETEKIVNNTEIVKELLTSVPEYRDNDEKLVASIWLQQIKARGINPTKVSAFGFFKDYSQGVYKTADSIIRTRAAVQKKFPELRGTTWEKRHGIATEVAKEIHTVLDEQKVETVQ